MPRNPAIKKVLVIGSGPIIIGQAAEFDYAGTQACRALKEDGLEVVLVNSNPATIMTDRDIADRVYIEPLTADTVRRIVEKEQPDSVLGTLGGQTGLNLCMELEDEGFWQAHHVQIIGTGAESIRRAEDRQGFKDTMNAIGEPLTASRVVDNLQDALATAEEIGYPVIVRPAYTLGGTGGGIADNVEQLTEIAQAGMRSSRVGQVLVEQCIAGWKEVEFEILRDANGNCINVCGMENIDPVGIHTGDSIVVAPCQTLADPEFQMLRTSAFNIVTALNIQGSCNVQFALHPDSFEYNVIEVNPRVSRSSALASKAAGYPIAKVATKIALGYTLDEIPNTVTGSSYASFEPTIDYVCVKIPKWPFDKFRTARRTLGTQMKATGEVMAISPSFEGALMKALRSLEQRTDSLMMPAMTRLSDEELEARLQLKDDLRLFTIAEALRRHSTLEHIHDITRIDMWFLNCIQQLTDMEHELIESSDTLTPRLLQRAKEMGFLDSTIGQLCNLSTREVRNARHSHGILPGFRVVDTCAGELAAVTPYYYSAYNVENESHAPQTKPRVLVLGSGPIRIGQGIEFDYCSVHCVWALRQAGYEAIIINNNPETVSTDFDISDRLYFEPLTPEDVQAVVDIEKPIGVVVQFGGQTAIKLAAAVERMGLPILGTSFDGVDAAEDRKRFDAILEDCGILRPKGTTVFTREEALAAAHELGYPVLIRPSYVLGGQGMQIVAQDADLLQWMDSIGDMADGHPILIDQYIMGLEAEVDAICDGHDILIPGVMEHLERAGVHSGDSISVYPPQRIAPADQEKLVDYTRKLALALKVVGLINIQFILANGQVYIIEANPRSSRTVPYISKITGIPVVDLATQTLFGKTLPELGYAYGLAAPKPFVAVKLPIFSFEKLFGAEVSLGPEMKSTGEVLGIADNLPEALMKAFQGGGVRLPQHRQLIATVNDSDKEELLPLMKRFTALGYTIHATAGTCAYLNDHGVPALQVNKISDGEPHILDMIHSNTVDLVINTRTHSVPYNKDGFLIRRVTVETGIPCLTSLDTAEALLVSLEHTLQKGLSLVDVAGI